MTVSNSGPKLRLPFIVSPKRGEAFASWVDRCSIELEVPPGRLLERLGLNMVDVATTAFSSYGVGLTDTEYRHVGECTRLERDVVADMLLSRLEGVLFDPAMFPSQARFRYSKIWNHWVILRGSRACRQCVDESGVWALNWKLGFSAVCPVHRVFLTDRCGVCGTGHRLRGDHREPVPRSHLVTVDGCRQYGHGRRCSGRVTDGVDTTAPADLVRFQHLLEQVAWTGVGCLLGVEVPARVWFESYVALASAVRFSVTADLVAAGLLAGFPSAAAAEVAEFIGVRDRGGVSTAGHSTPTYRRRPASAEWAAILLRAVTPILAAETEAVAFGGLEELHERVQQRRRVAGRDVIGPDIGLVGGLGEEWLRLEASQRRFTEAGRVLVLPRKVTDGRVKPDGSGIPQLVDAVRYNRLIASFLPGTAPLTGRCFAALAVARHRGARSWPAAGEMLGLGGRYAALRADVVSRRIVDRHGFWKSVAELSDDMAAATPVDYRLRREVLAGLTLLPRDRFRALAARFGVSPADGANRCAAAWLWGELVGSDWRWSPAVTCWPLTATPQSRREKVRQFIKHTPSAMCADLVEWGLELVEAR